MSLKRIWTEEQINDIINFYNKDGLTIASIAKKYGTKPNKISIILKENNIQIKNKGTSKNRLLNHDYFSNIDCGEKAYFLGLLFTDGSISKPEEHKNQSVSIELAEYDVGILQQFNEILNANCGLIYNKRKNRKNGTYKFSIRSNKIVNDLKKWNIIPNKTYEINSLIIPDKYAIDYFRGFIDGDGSIWLDNQGIPHINIVGHSEQIIRQIAILGNLLINENKLNKIQYADNVYRYVWNGRKALTLMSILYPSNNCLAIARKRDKARTLIEDK